ncbi:AI-2E family transporter [Bizionia sp. APA-3]|uniref:AI-2E family transporter n=1 Tax=Bizionia sp. APA-3 TaxID=1861784 RepID=UPI000A645396|nr:AI-2E family transporter [Bizionia sp. APA-3]
MSTPKIEISALNQIKTLLLVGGILTLLYFGQSLIMPLLVAAIIAILLDIPVKKIKSWGLPNWLAITIAILLMLTVFSLLFWLVSSQINNMAEDWPTMKEKATEKLNIFSQWTNEQLNWNYKDYIDNNKKLVQKAEDLASAFLSSLMSLLSQSLIIFVYIILFLMQKKQFINFFKKLSSNDKAMSSLLVNSAKINKKLFCWEG